MFSKNEQKKYIVPKCTSSLKGRGVLLNKNSWPLRRMEMEKLLKASLLFVILSILHNQAFGSALNCNFKSDPVRGIKSLQMTEDALFINGKVEIALEKSQIQCGVMGTRERYEGMDQGFKVVLKDCNVNDKLEGHLIDSVKQEVAEIECN